MKNRTIPFGYMIKNGELQPHPLEAIAVKRIYMLYLEGLSYAAIAAKMTGERVYYHANSLWNKHMIKRILENQRYTGTNSYPAIIATEIFAAVTEAKERKQPCRPGKKKGASTEEPVSEEEAPPPVFEATTTTGRKLMNDLNRALEGIGDMERIRSLIFACAAERYISLEKGGRTKHEQFDQNSYGDTR